jgi:hypothetical protein
MIFNAYFTTGRIAFIIFFVLAFGTLIFLSYKKDTKSHNRYYKNAGKKVLLYGGLIIAVFVAIRLIFGN